MGQAKGEATSTENKTCQTPTTLNLVNLVAKEDDRDCNLKMTNIYSINQSNKCPEIEKENCEFANSNCASPTNGVLFDCSSLIPLSVYESRFFEALQKKQSHFSESLARGTCYYANTSNPLQDTSKKTAIFAKSSRHSDFSNLTLLSEAAFSQSLRNDISVSDETSQSSSGVSSDDSSSGSKPRHFPANRTLARVRNNEACRKSRIKKKKYKEEVVEKIKILSEANSFMRNRISELEIEVVQTRSIVVATMKALATKRTVFNC